MYVGTNFFRNRHQRSHLVPVSILTCNNGASQPPLCNSVITCCTVVVVWSNLWHVSLHARLGLFWQQWVSTKKPFHKMRSSNNYNVSSFKNLQIPRSKRHLICTLYNIPNKIRHLHLLQFTIELLRV